MMAPPWTSETLVMRVATDSALISESGGFWHVLFAEAAGTMVRWKFRPS